jgi:hypothetical protein
VQCFGQISKTLAKRFVNEPAIHELQVSSMLRQGMPDNWRFTVKWLNWYFLSLLNFYHA